MAKHRKPSRTPQLSPDWARLFTLTWPSQPLRNSLKHPFLHLSPDHNGLGPLLFLLPLFPAARRFEPYALTRPQKPVSGRLRLSAPLGIRPSSARLHWPWGFKSAQPRWEKNGFLNSPSGVLWFHFRLGFVFSEIKLHTLFLKGFFLYCMSPIQNNGFSNLKWI